MSLLHADMPPAFTIGDVAKFLGVCPATLRIWERKGLIKPRRLGKNRLYSARDVELLKAIKELIRRQRLNIEGVKALINLPRCWDVKNCTPRQRESCPFFAAPGGLPFAAVARAQS
ncbi:MAG: MerR family transcriptional regulator [Elusimicrobia bacterium]|nr:MerR family transcriptional regulator [Elusimicrobiota bacterium]